MRNDTPLIDQMMASAGYVDPQQLGYGDQALGSYNSTDKMINGKVNPSYGMSFADFQKAKNYQSNYRNKQSQMIQSALGKGYTLEDLGIYDQPDEGQAIYNAFRDQNAQVHAAINSGQQEDPAFIGGGNPDPARVLQSIGVPVQQQSGTNQSNGGSSNGNSSMTSQDGTNLNSAPGVGVVQVGPNQQEYLAPGQYTRLDGKDAFNNLSMTNPNAASTPMQSIGTPYTPGPSYQPQQAPQQQQPQNNSGQTPMPGSSVNDYTKNPNQSGSGFSNLTSVGSFPGLGNSQKQRTPYGGANYGG